MQIKRRWLYKFNKRIIFVIYSAVYNIGKMEISICIPSSLPCKIPFCTLNLHPGTAQSNLCHYCLGYSVCMNYSDMKFGYFGVLLFEQVHDLGLEKSILAVPSSHPAARSRFIYSRGKLHQLPSGVTSIIKRQSLFSKSLLPTILREPFLRGKQDNGDESVYNFFKRRLNEEVCTGRL